MSAAARSARTDAPPAPQAGFADPVLESQRVFRVLLEAMARPGRVLRLESSARGVAPFAAEAMALALTLLDGDTPTWIDRPTPAIEAHLGFHCACPLVQRREDARFALISSPATLDGFEGFALGTAEYPDRSATLLLQVETVSARGVRLRGPGIETNLGFGAAPLPEGFWRWAQVNHGLYPLGLDLVFAAPGRLAAIPRSTAIELEA